MASEYPLIAGGKLVKTPTTVGLPNLKVMKRCTDHLLKDTQEAANYRSLRNGGQWLESHLALCICARECVCVHKIFHGYLKNYVHVF